MFGSSAATTLLAARGVATLVSRRGWGVEVIAATAIVAFLVLAVGGLTLRSLAFDPTRLVARALTSLGLASQRLISQSETQKVVEQLLHSHFDLELTCYWMLGSQWRRVQASQRVLVVEAFGRLLVREHAGALDRLSLSAVRTLPTGYRDLPGESVVRVWIPTTTQPMNIVLHFHYHRSWKIYDLQADDFGLVSHYRPLFKAALQDGGVEGLLGVLNRFEGSTPATL